MAIEGVAYKEPCKAWALEEQLVGEIVKELLGEIAVAPQSGRKWRPSLELAIGSRMSQKQTMIDLAQQGEMKQGKHHQW
jgi:hypothetical protein